MRAYIEREDEEFPTAMIEKRDEEGNIIEVTAWLTAPKSWYMELDDIDIILNSENGGKQ